MSDLAARRRFFAEEIQTISNLRSAALVDALASVPRERFLPPGPWTIRSEVDVRAAPRQTPDADPCHVYHNVAIALDAGRMLFNGAPSLLAMAIDGLALAPGGRALHIGTGTGYYTAIMAHCVGPAGRVVGLDVDPDLAAAASAHVASMPWVTVRHGDGTAPLDGLFDAILVNAGVTHPLDVWLDALAPGGRMIVPITASMAAMGAIGKGPLFLLTRGLDGDRLAAQVVTFVAIYSALGIRDEARNAALVAALSRRPFPGVRSLRRDPHEPSGTCWLHASACCLSLDSP